MLSSDFDSGSFSIIFLSVLMVDSSSLALHILSTFNSIDFDISDSLSSNGCAFSGTGSKKHVSFP
jgi:hypothetical protein